MQLPEGEAEKAASARQWVCERARFLRRRAGFTQNQLDKKMGVQPGRVSNFECNENDFRFSTVVRFCRAVGCSVEDFFKGCK